MNPVRESMLSYIRRHGLMRPGHRVGVAVSGGADSVALLRLLLEARAELGIVLSVVHFNHQIRGAEAEADEKFVHELARGFQLEFHGGSFDTPAHASFRNLSLEAAARELRYQFFWKLVSDGTVDRIATAHTRDDQAETVMLRLLRGAGTRGLAAIYPDLRLESLYSRNPIERRELPIGDSPWIVRPLLQVTREELRAYLREAGQAWREDASNQDVSFARNRLRHEILPALRRLNPNLDQTLSETAEIARADEAFWQEHVRCLLPKLVRQSASDKRQPAMSLEVLQAQPLALQRRLVRALAEQQGLRLQFHHVEEVLAMARASAPPARVELPQGWTAVRQQRELWFQRRGQNRKEQREYDCPLPVAGEVEIPGRKIHAELVPAGDSRLGTRDLHCALLDPALAERSLRVRNWHAGDRYWPAHTSGPEKLKELLQARHIPRAQKPFWPVVTVSAKSGQMWGTTGCSTDEIVWVPGFAAPERFRLRDRDSGALLLEELPLENSGGNTR